MSVALIKRASSVLKKRTVLATSKGSPNRLTGIKLRCFSRSILGLEQLSKYLSANGVSINPGETELTRIPNSANSIASERVNPISACFDTV